MERRMVKDGMLFWIAFLLDIMKSPMTLDELSVFVGIPRKELARTLKSLSSTGYVQSKLLEGKKSGTLLFYRTDKDLEFHERLFGFSNHSADKNLATCKVMWNDFKQLSFRNFAILKKWLICSDISDASWRFVDDEFGFDVWQLVKGLSRKGYLTDNLEYGTPLTGSLFYELITYNNEFMLGFGDDGPTPASHEELKDAKLAIDLESGKDPKELVLR